MEPIILYAIKELSIDKQIEALEGLDWSLLDGRAKVYQPGAIRATEAPEFGLCYMLALRFKVKIPNSTLFTNPGYNELAVLIPTFNRAKAIEFLRANYPNDFYLECLSSYWFQRNMGGDKQRKEFIEYLIKDLKAKQNGR